MAIFIVIVTIISCILAGEVTGETTDCSILKHIIKNCSCEGKEGEPIIYCRRHQLTEVPAISNTSLYNGTIAELTLSENDIEHIPDNAFMGLRIKKLDLTMNKLHNVSDLAFKGLEESLQILKIGGYGNATAPFTAMKKLTKLTELTMKNYKVPSTDMTNATFLSFTKLKTLILDSWNVKSIEGHVFDGLGEVTKLVLTRFDLESMPHEALLTLTKLEKLEITHCKLTRITDYSFQEFHNLVEINFSHNLIKDIEKQSFDGITDRLLSLNLGYNEISTSLTALGFLTALQSLQLQNIGLLKIPPYPFFLTNKNNLQYLSLAANHISNVTDMAFVSTPNLINLDLSGNQILTFHENAFFSIPNLKQLVLDNQKLPTSKTMTLPSFVNLTSLETLNLQNTRLDPVSSWDKLKEATSLQSLNLDSTGLSIIKDFTFEHFTRLKTLDLNGNSISNITWKSLFGLKNTLTNIFLNSNNIQTVEKCTFYNFTTHLMIHLYNNSLNCDCRMKWLRRAQLEKTVILSQMEKCMLPNEKLFNKMSLSDFVCNYTYTDEECPNYYTTTPMTTTTIPTTTHLPRFKIVASITATTETSITVSWTIPQSALVHIVGIFVEHVDLSDPANKGTSDLLNPNIALYEIRGLTIGTRYEIIVKALRTDNLTDSDSIQSPTKSKPASTTVKSEPPSDDSEIGIIIGAVIGGVLFLLILVAILYLIFIRRRPEKTSYPVQPRTFTPAELPSIGYDSKRYIRKKKPGDKKEDINVTVISDGKTHKDRVSAGSYQNLDTKAGKVVSHEPNHNPAKSRIHSYVNEKPPHSTNEYENDVDIRKLPKVPAEYRGNATKSGGYYNPSFRNSSQDGSHEYSEINL